MKTTHQQQLREAMHAIQNAQAKMTMLRLKVE